MWRQRRQAKPGVSAVIAVGDSCTQITNVGALIIRGFGGYVVAFSLLELLGPKKFKLSKIELKGQKT